MAVDAAQREAVYADAMKGDPRAVRVWQQLEDWYAESGRTKTWLYVDRGCRRNTLSSSCSWRMDNWPIRPDTPGGRRLNLVFGTALATSGLERKISTGWLTAVLVRILDKEDAAMVLREAEAAKVDHLAPDANAPPSRAPKP
jgi:hypothetical protein